MEQRQYQDHLVCMRTADRLYRCGGTTGGRIQCSHLRMRIRLMLTELQVRLMRVRLSVKLELRLRLSLQLRCLSLIHMFMTRA